MLPIPVPPPPVQGARWVSAPLRSPSEHSTVRKEIRPIPPPASRIDQRPTVTDKWGRMAGLGADTERLQVQAPSGASDLAPALACGVLGFLAFGFLSR